MSENIKHDVTRLSAQALPEAADVRPTADEEIYCPICNYNLTGILTGRCPECGSFFDRQALMANQQANRITLIPWDDPAETEFWPRFKKTLAICLFDAKRFAFAFSVQRQDSRAYSFLKIVTLLLVLAFIAMSAMVLPVYWFVERSDIGQFSTLSLVIFEAAAIVSALLSLVVTTLLAAVALGIWCRHFDAKRHFKPWLSIAMYASAHYLLFPLGLPLLLFLIVWSKGVAMAGVVLAYSAIWLACGLLNACTLNAVIQHRGAKTGARSVAILAIYLLYFFLPILVQIVVFAGAAILQSLFFRY